MKNRKKYIHILILFSLTSQITYTQNVDEKGKTKLIKYIEQRDKDFINLKNEVSKLWNDSMYRTEKTTGSGNYQTRTITYNIKPSCSRYTLQKIYYGRQDLKKFTQDTQKEMVKSSSKCNTL